MPLGRSLGASFAGLLVWQLLCSIGIASPTVVATPLETGGALFENAKAGILFSDSGATLGRALLALLIAASIATPIGLTLCLNERISGSVRPVIDFLRTIPPIVAYPPLVVALGPFNSARILTGAIGAALVMTVIISTTSGGFGSPRARFLFAHRIRPHVVFRDVVLPEAVPGLLSAIKAGASLAFVFVVVTELFMGADFGLGSRIQYAQVTGRMPEAYACAFAVGACGSLLNLVIERLERRFARRFVEDRARAQK